MSKSPNPITCDNLPPVHPGEILADELKAIEVSVTALARALDVPQSRMAEIIKGERGITADTALRLGAYFGTSPRFWLNLQVSYDLAVAQERDGARIVAAVRPRAA